MRISNKIMSKRLVTYLQKSKERLMRSQERISTTKKIQQPSDDSVGFMKIMSYRRDLYKLRQTVRNAKSASINLYQMDTTLSSVGDILLDSKNKATAMVSDTVGANERLAIAKEVDLIINDMTQKANTQIAGRYIFSGHRVFTRPYVEQMTAEDSTVALSGGVPVGLDYSVPADADVTITIYDNTGAAVRTVDAGTQVSGDYTYSWDGLDDGGAALPDGDYDYIVSADFGQLEYVGDEGLIEQQIELGGSIVANIPGSDIFGTSESGIFVTLTALKTALEENDRDGIQGSISALDADIEHIAGIRGEVGIKLKRVYTSISELGTMEPILEGNLAESEDVDMIMEAGKYMANQEAYQATLETTSTTLRLPNLLDYMR